MKKNNSLKAIGKTGILAAMVLIASCNSNDTLKSPAAPASNAAVKPPKVDIHTAVITDDLDALKQHIAAGSNLDEKDPMGGSSPLITAALFDKAEMASALLEAGADINFRNNDGSTALHTASFFCRPGIVKMLLDKGADKTIVNKYGSTAFGTVAAPFTEAKNSYDMMGQMLAPMGLKLDYSYIKKTRPEIAAILK